MADAKLKRKPPSLKPARRLKPGDVPDDSLEAAITGVRRLLALFPACDFASIYLSHPKHGGRSIFIPIEPATE